jgi:hypothetical protein
MRARQTTLKSVGGNPVATRNGSPDAEARERRKRLTSLLPLWPADIEDTSVDGRARLVTVLERALRAERRRGLSGHWTYDLARHMQLLEAWRAEIRALNTATRNMKRNRPREPEVRSRFKLKQ